jgi:hypothetical protein
MRSMSVQEMETTLRWLERTKDGVYMCRTCDDFLRVTETVLDIPGHLRCGRCGHSVESVNRAKVINKIHAAIEQATLDECWACGNPLNGGVTVGCPGCDVSVQQEPITDDNDWMYTPGDVNRSADPVFCGDPSKTNPGL